MMLTSRCIVCPRNFHETNGYPEIGPRVRFVLKQGAPNEELGCAIFGWDQKTFHGWVTRDDNHIFKGKLAKFGTAIGGTTMDQVINRDLEGVVIRASSFEWERGGGRSVSGQIKFTDHGIAKKD